VRDKRIEHKSTSGSAARKTEIRNWTWSGDQVALPPSRKPLSTLCLWHIEADRPLYKVDATTVGFERTGTHADLYDG
jgi:hypothetical protein